MTSHPPAAPQPLGPARTARSLRDDSGTTIPLILGFFILALLVAGGSIAASDALQDQRDLQSICDGAVLAGADALDPAQIYDDDAAARTTLPLGIEAEDAILSYLQRDSQRDDVTVDAALLGADGALTITCTATMELAFGAMFAHPNGITHHVTATARSPLRHPG